ncbi:hypothetical protein RND71_036364 [Anisodus tanguticus]|uniref:Uncharacterized protein n=1 Tax=Anisodus tanguticus TaxID=243964 RepID=A0AAE1V061_9SOLA|nr:hypothetical protein RND71_036364 [Anisodus tanguticus]
MQSVHSAAMALSSSLCPILYRSDPQLSKRLSVHFPHVTALRKSDPYLAGPTWYGIICKPVSSYATTADLQKRDSEMAVMIAFSALLSSLEKSERK